MTGEIISKEAYLSKMAENLSMLRTKLGLTQEALCNIAGVSRQTIVQAERNKKLSWNTYLSLVFIFSQSPETKALLDFLEIFPKEFSALFEPKQPDLQKEAF